MGKVAFVYKVGDATDLFFSMENSAKIVGIGERDCAIYDPNGLDVEELFKYYRANQTFRGYSKTRWMKQGTAIRNKPRISYSRLQLRRRVLPSVCKRKLR